jgi:hypothetical protein
MTATMAIPGLVGVETPRLWTRPLRPITPDTSRGFEVVEYGAGLGVEFMPWQQFALTHGLETREDGTYRFRVVLVLVSRQNGKTTIPKVLTLWRMQQDGTTVLGTSTNLDYARESWELAVDLAEHQLLFEVDKVLRGSINTQMRMRNGSRYKIAAANRRGGRSLSVDLGVADELREHQTWDAWGALSGTTTARPDPQIWALSNAGDDSSVVLNHLREAALSYIESGDGDDSIGLFEWSAEDGCELDDRQAWAQANPALGHTVREATMVSKLATCPPAVFRTEHLCQRVSVMESAVDLAAWSGCEDVGTLDGLRDRVALCVDVSLDLQHVTLVAAAMAGDGRVRVEVVEAWESVHRARADLRPLFDRIKPRAFGWFPKGPGASLAADLKTGFDPEALADVNAVCLGLAEQVSARRILQSGDDLLAAQLSGTAKLWSGDGWRFTRKGHGHCDAVYALAGAVHLARTLPPPKPALVVL